MTLDKIVFALGTLLAACSGSPLRSADAPNTRATVCEGGSVRSDAELERFAHCATVEGDLDIAEVTSVTALERLRSVQGELAIHDTTRLYSLCGLEQLASVGTLRIEANRGLIGIGSLNTLAHAGSVSIVRNPRLSRTGGFMDGLARDHVKFSVVGNVGLRAEGVASGARASMF